MNYLRLNTIKILLLTLLSAYLFSGCEDVITYDLKNAEPQIVIEGIITDQATPQYVKISKTTDYFNPGDYTKISNANVVILDQAGNEINLTEKKPGLYETENLSIGYNNNYKLKISAENKVFNATTKLVEPMLLDSISYGKISNFGQTFYEITLNFQDNSDKKEFVIIDAKLNGKDFEFPIFYDDRLSNGNYMNLRFNMIPQDSLKNGINEFAVRMRTVDEQTFNYYNELYDIIIKNSSASPFSPSSPANPKSNISNNALGYFGAYAISEKSVVIKK